MAPRCPVWAMSRVVSSAGSRKVLLDPELGRVIADGAAEGSDDETRDRHGGRRPAGVGRSGPRPATALRTRLPARPGLVRRRGARGAGRARAARPAGGPGRRRPADAADDRHRGAGRGPVPWLRRGGQARAADGVRRHRRRHPGHQRHRPRPLPDEAVGPARGAAVPGARRPARRLAQREPRPHLGRARGRPPLVRARLRGQDVPGPQPRAVPLVRRRARRGGQAARGARRRHGRRPAARAAAGGRAAALPHQRPGRRRPGPAHPGPAAVVRRVHRRRRSGRAGVGRVRRVRGPVHDRGRGPGAGRAGRHQCRDRELPRLPQGPQRRRPHPAGDGPGAALRRRDGAGPRRGRAGAARAGPGRGARRRRDP